MGRGKKAKQPGYYVVWKGVSPGIYLTWNEAKAQVQGYPGALFRKFFTKEAAEKALVEGYTPPPEKPEKEVIPDGTSPIFPSISTDAACNMETREMEFCVVDSETKVVLAERKNLHGATNNMGEFLALVLAIAYCQRNPQLHDMPIYTDSHTAMSWLRNKRVRTTTKESEENKPVFDMLRQAVKWLHEHTWRNPILKWKTDQWGEIPADYGRK